MQSCLLIFLKWPCTDSVCLSVLAGHMCVSTYNSEAMEEFRDMDLGDKS